MTFPSRATYEGKLRACAGGRRPHARGPRRPRRSGAARSRCGSSTPPARTGSRSAPTSIPAARSTTCPRSRSIRARSTRATPSASPPRRAACCRAGCRRPTSRSSRRTRRRRAGCATCFATSARPGVEIGTVDGFQGREKEAVIVDLVRSNDHGEIGFLANTRRMNVALTRARRFLLVVADSATLGDHPYYAQFLEYVDEIDAPRERVERRRRALEVRPLSLRSTGCRHEAPVDLVVRSSSVLAACASRTTSRSSMRRRSAREVVTGRSSRRSTSASQTIFERGTTIPATPAGHRRGRQRLTEARDTLDPAARHRRRRLPTASRRSRSRPTSPRRPARSTTSSKLIHDTEATLDDGMRVINDDLDAVESWLAIDDAGPRDAPRLAAPPAPTPRTARRRRPSPRPAAPQAPAPSAGQPAQRHRPRAPAGRRRAGCYAGIMRIPAQPKVILRVCREYDPERIRQIVREGLEELGLRPFGRTLVKPNLVAAGPLFPHAYTRPEFVEGVLRALRDVGGDVDDRARGRRALRHHRADARRVRRVGLRRDAQAHRRQALLLRGGAAGRDPAHARGAPARLPVHARAGRAAPTSSSTAPSSRRTRGRR